MESAPHGTTQPSRVVNPRGGGGSSALAQGSLLVCWYARIRDKVSSSWERANQPWLCRRGGPGRAGAGARGQERGEKLASKACEAIRTSSSEKGAAEGEGEGGEAGEQES